MGIQKSYQSSIAMVLMNISILKQNNTHWHLRDNKDRTKESNTMKIDTMIDYGLALLALTIWTFTV